MGKLISKAEYAEMCGVTAASVTKQLKGALSAALRGRRIDLEHPEAQKYLAKATAPRPEEPVSGIDPLFEEALDLCRKERRFNASMIERQLKVGYRRALKILEQLTAAGHCVKPETIPPEPKNDRAPRRRTSKKDMSTDPYELISGTAEELGQVVENVAALAMEPFYEVIARFSTGTRMYDWLRALKEIEAVNEKRIKNTLQEGKLVNRDLVKTAILDRIDGVFIKLLTDATTTISSRAHAMAKAGESEKEIKIMVEDQLSSFIRPAKDKMREALRDAKT